MPEQRWLGTAEAAAYIGVGKVKLYQLVHDGVIPAYRPSRSMRFRITDLDDYLDSVRVQPGDVAHLAGCRPVGNGNGNGDNGSCHVAAGAPDH